MIAGPGRAIRCRARVMLVWLPADFMRNCCATARSNWPPLNERLAPPYARTFCMLGDARCRIAVKPAVDLEQPDQRFAADFYLLADSISRVVELDINPLWVTPEQNDSR